MNRLNRHQKDKVRQFVAVADVSERVALEVMKASNWNVEVSRHAFLSAILINRSRNFASFLTWANCYKLESNVYIDKRSLCKRAFEHFYSMSKSKQRVSINTKAIEDLFAKYKDPDDDRILADGVSQFCDDLGVDPFDIVMVSKREWGFVLKCDIVKHKTLTESQSFVCIQLVISYQMKAEYMCEFTYDEFCNGFAAMEVDSITKLIAKLQALRDLLKNEGA